MPTVTAAQREAATQLADAIVRFVQVNRGALVTHLERFAAPVARATPSVPVSPVSRPSTRPAEPEPLLIDMREVARLLGVSDRTVWQLTQPRGTLPAVKFGRSVRYSIDDVKKWVQQNSQ